MRKKKKNKMKSKINYKNRSQLEKEISNAQKKLANIFFKDIDDKINLEGYENKENSISFSNPSVKAVGGPRLAYNKFNDEELNVDDELFQRVVTKNSKRF